MITYKEVEKKYKNIKLEDMTSEDLFERYIVCGEEDELNSPKIQKMLIKCGYVNILTDMVYFIKDKEVVKNIFLSDLFQDKNITFKIGKVQNIKFIEDETEPECFISQIDFIDKKSKEKIMMKRSCVF